MPCPCCDCPEQCWGACVNKENALQCFGIVNGVLEEVACPPCGDECYYNSTSWPGYAYVCLITKTQEECEAILDIDGNPSIWLGCGSLQKECYYNECNGLWFPLPGSSKGDAYILGCSTVVSNNCASEFCVEGCGSPCCE